MTSRASVVSQKWFLQMAASRAIVDDNASPAINHLSPGSKRPIDEWALDHTSFLPKRDRAGFTMSLFAMTSRSRNGGLIAK
jgi:hypothetical protein